MTKTRKPNREAPVDMARRRALKTLGKAAYVAPAVSLIPMDSLAVSSRACSNFMPDIQNKHC